MAEVQAGYKPHSIPGARQSAVRRLLGRDWLLGWLLVGPVLLIVVALLIYPFIDAILLSFQRRLIGQSAVTWAGFQNYIDIFRDPESNFLKASCV